MYAMFRKKRPSDSNVPIVQLDSSNDWGMMRTKIEHTDLSEPPMDCPTYLRDLNFAQRATVKYGDSDVGPLLVIAGAGTGKTNTLAHRVAHLTRISHSAADFRQSAREATDKHMKKVLVVGLKRLGSTFASPEGQIGPDGILGWIY